MKRRNAETPKRRKQECAAKRHWFLGVAGLLAVACLIGASQRPPVQPPAGPAPAPEAQPDDKKPKQPKEPPREEVTIKDELFKLEIAADVKSRAKGLMGREELDDDGGMIFIFPREERLSFWMYDCKIDIDVIYLDRYGRVVSKHEMKAPAPRKPDETEWAYQGRLRYGSKRPAQFAIELKKDSLERLEIEIGEKIELDLRRLKKMAK